MIDSSTSFPWKSVDTPGRRGPRSQVNVSRPQDVARRDEEGGTREEGRGARRTSVAGPGGRGGWVQLVWAGRPAAYTVPYHPTRVPQRQFASLKLLPSTLTGPLTLLAG